MRIRHPRYRDIAQNGGARTRGAELAARMHPEMFCTPHTVLRIDEDTAPRSQGRARGARQKGKPGREEDVQCQSRRHRPTAQGSRCGVAGHGEGAVVQGVSMSPSTRRAQKQRAGPAQDMGARTSTGVD